MADVVILTMSEFGRAVRQKAIGEPDMAMALASSSLGGSAPEEGARRLAPVWPEQLFEERDLAVTTDYGRLGEIARASTWAPRAGTVFPGYTSIHGAGAGIEGVTSDIRSVRRHGVPIPVSVVSGSPPAKNLLGATPEAQIWGGTRDAMRCRKEIRIEFTLSVESDTTPNSYVPEAACARML